MRCRRPSPVAAGSDYVADFDAIFTDEVFIDGTCSSAVVVAMAHWPKALATGEATGRLGLAAGPGGWQGRAAWQGQRKGSWLKVFFPFVLKMRFLNLRSGMGVQ